MTASMARLGWRLLDISQRHRLSSLSVVCGAKRHFSTPRPSSFSRSNNSDEGFVRQSPLEDVVVPNVTLDKYIWRDINKWANHTAVVCGVTGRQYTYARLRDHCAALAIRLQHKFNLESGDVIAICLPNCPEYPVATFGAIEAGLVVTTINPTYTADEIQRQLMLSNVKLIIGSVSSYETLRKAVDETKIQIPVVCVKLETNDSMPAGAIDFCEMANTTNVDYSQLKPHNRQPDDIVILPFSSGTTGLPKGVMLSHNNIAVNCEMLDVKLPDKKILRPTTADFQECSPSVLPFFHIYGLTVLMVSKLTLGTKVVTLPRFQPDTFMNSISEHGGTMLHLVPPIVIFMGSMESISRETLKNVRCIMSGAAPCGAMDVERLLTKAPQIEFMQGYGLTETAPAVLIDQPGSKKYASVGVPTSCTEAKIVDLSDTSLKGLEAYKKGELLVRGPQVMLGYLNNKEATDEMITPDGWLRTGDLAYYDDDGSFFITDRLKELIKVKGYQVPPAELEELLRSHPCVADAAVIGIEHEKHGEVPCAFVVRKKGSDLSEKDVQKFVAGKTAAYKHLHGGVRFMDAIPKNPSGKILRRELKLSLSK